MTCIIIIALVTITVITYYYYSLINGYGVYCVGGRLTIALLLTVCVCVLKVAVEMAVYGVIIKRIMLAMVC